MPKCEMTVLRAELHDSGAQADVLVVEPNGDAHEVRCLARMDGTTEVGEPEDNSMME